MKKSLLKLMMKSGAFAPFRLMNRRKALILTYHRFSESENKFAISCGLLEHQLDYLTKRYQIISLSDLAEYLKTNKPLPDKCAVITIDDGYRDVYEIAFPVLKKFNVPATVFVVTDFLDEKKWIWTDKMRYIMSRVKEAEFNLVIGDEDLKINLNGESSRFLSAQRVNNRLKKMEDSERDETIKNIAASLNVEIPSLPSKEFAPLTWQQVREMDTNKVSIESHTVTHPVLTNTTDEQLSYELTKSRARLEQELNRRVNLFCYPNGNNNIRVHNAVKNAGYDCAVTTNQGFNDVGVDLYSLKRFDAEFDMGHFAQTTSGFELWRNSRRNGASKPFSE